MVAVGRSPILCGRLNSQVRSEIAFGSLKYEIGTVHCKSVIPLKQEVYTCREIVSAQPREGSLDWLAGMRFYIVNFAAGPSKEKSI